MKTKHLIKIIAAVAIFALSANLLFAEGKMEAAQKSAEQWVALVDAGKYAESWKTAAGYFQTAVAQDQWEQKLVSVRKPLGDLVERKFKSATYTKSAPGAPDGEYMTLQFGTSFSEKKGAVETVALMLEKDGKWKLAGYFIK